MSSDTNAVNADLQRLFESVVRVTTDEVLEMELGVSKVLLAVFVGLAVASDERLLEVSSVPDPLLHVSGLKHGLSLLHEFISAHLDVLVEEVAAEHLLAILVVHSIVSKEHQAKSGLGHKLHVLVVEVHVVIVKEDETGKRSEHQELFVVRIVNVQVSHVIIPLRVMGIEEHRVERELRSNSLDNIE